MRVVNNHSPASLRVLIADDSPVIRTMLANILKTIDGVELVGQASEVPTAITAVSRLKPDVLVVDFRMPGGTGIDVVQAANAERFRPAIIMFTAQSTLLYRMAAMNAGADVFLDKSSETTLLIDILKRMRTEYLTAVRKGDNSQCTNNFSPTRMGIPHPHHHQPNKGATP